MAGGDAAEAADEEIFEIECKLYQDHVKMDEDTIANMLYEGHKNRKPSELLDFLMAYMKRWDYTGAICKWLMEKDRNATVKILKKYFGEEINNLY